MTIEPATYLWPGTVQILSFMFAIWISFQILEYLAKKIGLVK